MDVNGPSNLPLRLLYPEQFRGSLPCELRGAIVTPKRRFAKELNLKELMEICHEKRPEI